ncbi:MAG: tetratricopeptide (TPR) repeat protein [Halioglobus sp.]
MLAREVAAQERTDQTNLAMMSWLRSAALADYFPAKVHLAWELSTTSSEHLRNPQETLQLLEDEDDDYFDEVRVLETSAAAYAQLGEYEKAIKFQKKALSVAEDLEWSIPDMQDRLGLYEHAEPWVGAYY